MILCLCIVGPAAVMCAQTLRQEQFEGKIIMISKDTNYPYDRTKLSKNPGVNWNDIKLREPEFFQVQNRIIVFFWAGC